MAVNLESGNWYELILPYGKKFTALYKDGDLIFTDGSSKSGEDVIPFLTDALLCDPPSDNMPIIDFLDDEEE